MPRLDSIFQFIVPLTFLAIWALTSLVNRESQPLPSRTNRPPGPPGPKPGLPPRPAERPAEGVPRDPSLRWQPTAPAGDRAGARRPPPRPDDDILIIEPEPRRAPPTPPQRSGSGNTPRRGTRARVAPPAAKRPEPAAPRALSASMAKESETQISRHLEMNPLGRVQSPLSTQQSHDISRVGVDPNRPTVTRGGAAAMDITSMLSSPAKLREAFVVNELLQPPLALRRPRG